MTASMTGWVTAGWPAVHPHRGKERWQLLLATGLQASQHLLVVPVVSTSPRQLCGRRLRRPFYLRRECHRLRWPPRHYYQPLFIRWRTQVFIQPPAPPNSTVHLEQESSDLFPFNVTHVQGSFLFKPLIPLTGAASHSE